MSGEINADAWLRALIPAPPAPERAQGTLDHLLSMHRVPDMGYTSMDTPVGTLYVAFTPAGLAYLSLTAENDEALAAELARRYGCGARRDDRARPRYARLLHAWVQGKSARPRLDLSRLTPFEQAVLGQVLRIGRGKVRPYSWVAREAGRPQASRAVGQVVAHNPVPLIIPCHRVVPVAGGLGNYSAGGPAVKERLLRLEGVDVDRLERLAGQGLRFEGSRTTRIFCIPGCRPVKPEHLVYFPSAARAYAAGYRPCRICRPV